MKALVAVGLMLALAACDRTHMRKSFGQANREAYAAQVVNPTAGSESVAETGLDPEEAATISKNYRRSLSGDKGKEAEPKDSILILQKPDEAKRGAEK